MYEITPEKASHNYSKDLQVVYIICLLPSQQVHMIKFLTRAKLILITVKHNCTNTNSIILKYKN